MKTLQRLPFDFWVFIGCMMVPAVLLPLSFAVINPLTNISLGGL